LKHTRILIWLSLVLTLSAGTMQAQFVPIRVACVGNSITYGAFSDQPYPQQLGKLLGSGYDVRNFGVSGTTMLKKGDYPYWNETAYVAVLDFNPHVIILCLGTNDSKPQNWVYKDEFYGDYLDMLRVFRSVNPNIHILACSPPPVFKDGYGITNSIIRDEIIPIVRRVRKTAVTDSIDFYGKMLDKGTLFPDGIHPNATGYLLMANIAHDAILNSPSGIIRYFNALPVEFEKDAVSVLYWKTTTNSNATINGTPVQDSDSMTVRPADTTRYTLLTGGAFSDTAELTLNVLPGKIRSFTADPCYLDLGGGDSTLLKWETKSGSTVKLDGMEVDPIGSKTETPTETTTYTLIANGEISDTSRVTVFVLPSDQINRAFGKPVKASSTERGVQAQWAVDGDTSTVWKSNTAPSQWIQIDLGANFDVKRVVLIWGKTYGVLYHLQTPDANGQIRKRIYSNTHGDGGVDDVNGLNEPTRLIRMLCLTKSNPDSGLVLKEFQVYGVKSSPSNVGRSAGTVPLSCELSQNYPNPFNPSTRIKWSLSSGGKASIRIYDSTGREAAVLADAYQSPGPHQADFNAAGLPSGIYVCRLKAGGRMQSMKMLLLR
jgi:lysophospholipase L1-like esterase